MEKEPAANLRSALKIPAFQSSGPLLGSTGSRHHRRSGAGDASRGLVRRLLVGTFVGGLCGFILVLSLVLVLAVAATNAGGAKQASNDKHRDQSFHSKSSFLQSRPKQ